MKTNNLVYTDESACLGCNKCVFKCPTDANEAFLINGENKIFIRDGHCISCGECISICDHNARHFKDDAEIFFEDLKNGKNISIIVAPSVVNNFKNHKKLFSYLRSLGVNLIYDVSIGADICTWAHIKYLKENAVKSLIAEPCPVVVGFIERYHKELISILSPIQSPVLCTAIFLEKYQNVNTDLALISPCIEKKQECMSTKSNIKYSVTFLGLLNYINENNINLDEFLESDYDNEEGGLGFLFPRPGGLLENIKYHLNEDIWIKKIEGIFNIEEYLKEYVEDLNENRPVPKLIDALNCIHGCNMGTAATNYARFNEIDYKTNARKKAIDHERVAKIFNYFNEKLDVSDFKRTYTDRSADYIKEENVDLESAFIELTKFTKEDRNVNCFSCGYGSCEEFAYALAKGRNHKNNCKFYLLNKFKRLSFIDDLTGAKNRTSYNEKLEEARNKYGNTFIVFADINGLKEANDAYGHLFGDKLIINCANALREIFGDNVFRVGGDEFIVLEKHLTKELFEVKIKELKDKIANTNGLIVSLGTAICTENSKLDEYIDKADKAMYKEKQRYYKEVKKVDRRSYK